MHALIPLRGGRWEPASPTGPQTVGAAGPWGRGEYGGLRTGPGSKDTLRRRAGIITVVTATEPPGRDAWMFSGLLLQQTGLQWKTSV